MTDAASPLLRVEGLDTSFDTDDGLVAAAKAVDLTIEAGETVGLVGESGSGKSVTALSIMGLIDPPGYVVSERIDFKGEDLLGMDDRRRRELRGDELAMIFQDPMESLNPVLRVGDQIAESLRAHGKVAGEDVGWLESSVIGNVVPRRGVRTRYPESWARAVELMRRVGIPEPDQRAMEYPHQFSGGMQQRAMIAMALACDPDLLIADEPTTALDVTIQAQILELLGEIQTERGMSVLFITHDLGVVREVCDRVAVMYAGEIVETGTVESVFAAPAHPYTRALFRAIPHGRKRSEQLRPIGGAVPDLIGMPNACYFAPRCPYAHESCIARHPRMYDAGHDHRARCVLYDEADAYGPAVFEEDEAVGGTEPSTGGVTSPDGDRDG